MEPRRFGAIRGIPIEVHAGAGVVVALLAIALAYGAFPVLAPGYAFVTYLAAGVIAGVALLASVLVHEAAHAVVAQRYGVPVASIRLWILGGIAHLEAEAPTPRAEAWIAGVGPLTSVLIALGVGAGAAGWLAIGWDPLVGMTLAWVAGSNALLALFNLLPGLPLDGGRLLHAALWKRRGDRASATATAATAGFTIGGLLVVVGVVEVGLGANPAGLWTSFVGWFLVMAARREGAEARVESLIGSAPIDDLMGPAPTEVPDWLPVADVAAGAGKGSTERFLAVDFDGRPTAVAGVAELGRIAAGTPEPSHGLGVRLRDLGLPTPVKVEAGTPAAAALKVMRGPLLVTRAGAVVGVVTRVDVTRYLMTRKQRRGRTLRPAQRPID